MKVRILRFGHPVTVKHHIPTRHAIRTVRSHSVPLNSIMRAHLKFLPPPRLVLNLPDPLTMLDERVHKDKKASLVTSCSHGPN